LKPLDVSGRPRDEKTRAAINERLRADGRLEGAVEPDANHVHPEAFAQLELTDRPIAKRTFRLHVEFCDLEISANLNRCVVCHSEQEGNFPGKSLPEQLAGRKHLIGPRHPVVGLECLIVNYGHRLNLIAELPGRQNNARGHRVLGVNHERRGRLKMDAFEGLDQLRIAANDRIPIEIERLGPLGIGLKNHVALALRLKLSDQRLDAGRVGREHDVIGPGKRLRRTLLEGVSQHRDDEQGDSEKDKQHPRQVHEENQRVHL
jgi:hypothetical protein